MTASPSTDIDWRAEQARMEAEWTRIEAGMRSMERQAAEAAVTAESAASEAPSQPWTAVDTLRDWKEFERNEGISEEGWKVAANAAKTAVGKALDYFDVDAEARPKSGVDWQGLRDHLLEEAGDAAAEHIGGAIKKHVGPPPLPKKSLQWHYALDDESHGPVSEEELVRLLEDGQIKLSTLVWNKTMDEWTRFADTPLAEKVAPAPPPLPAAKKSSKTKVRGKSASLTCPSCGHTTGPEDRFCPDCGAPLKN